MSQSDPKNSTSDVSLESVMAEYLECQEEGLATHPQAFLEKYPQHAAGLKSFFANHHWIQDGGSPEAPTLVGQCLGDFELTREIARGGMGVVYEASQKSLNRNVAVKLISEGILADEELRVRFRMEAEAAGGLTHPNILPIHAVGSWQGIDYFVMPLIEGGSLQEQVLSRHANRESSVDVETVRGVIAMVRDIARGVAFAHRRGIIHRDLKPENVLLDENGQPKIVDFGLAKWIMSGPAVTRDGQVLGTPHYMSPEQARGESDVTAATDVYSLGGLLFALLVGDPPHAGDSVAKVLSNVLSEEPPSLRLSWPGGMPRIHELMDGEKVLAKAMAFDRKDRYRSADDLADDLQRLLDGETVSACSDQIVKRVARELNRDQHQASFAAWGKALWKIGVIVLLTHVMMFGFQETLSADALDSLSKSAWTTTSLLAYFLPRVLMLVGIAWVIHRARDGVWMPRGSAERPVWSIWLGYLATLTLVNLLWAIGTFDYHDVLILASVMSGFAFIAMAGHLWGGNAILGGVFFIAALIATQTPRFAALLVGMAWMLSMTVLAIRYRN